jgi:hypothetical protein
MSFSNAEVLLNREVPVLLEWSTESVSWSAPVSMSSCSGGVRDIRLRCSPSLTAIQEVREFSVDAACGVGILRARTFEEPGAGAAAEGAATGVGN